MNTETSPRRIARPDQAELIDEWNSIALLRRRQIAGGADKSFTDTLRPAIVERAQVLLANVSPRRIVDVGSGTGELTHSLTALSAEVLGIDPSGMSVGLAARTFPSSKFRRASIEDFSLQHAEWADLVVANMLLMNVVDLSNAVRSLASVVRVNGHVVATITHPVMWPKYWDYENESWFSYEQEIFVRAGWKISSDAAPSTQMTTHAHRPLSQYISAFTSAGLVLKEIAELGATSTSRTGQAIRPIPKFMLFTLARAI